MRWFALLWLGLAMFANAADRSPNIVVIFADDLGYGDLGCYGHPTIRTPNLDRMAAQGQRWTDFYVAECVCSPSRTALLTGRLPIRSGMCGDVHRVIFGNSTGGLPASEITLAQALRGRGYTTGAVGKWHLGHLPQYLPTQKGFDSFFGLPYSNDMDRLPTAPKGRIAIEDPKIEYFNVPLYRDDTIIERPAEQSTLTRRYTDEALKFIRQNKSKPFFLYFAHTFPHVPLFASENFKGKSGRGIYGDVVEELDWSVGRVLDTLAQEGLAENTLVVFTSDNGPWLIQDAHGGSAGLLREGKGSTWEGGMRVPGIFWWPGRIKPAVVRQLGTTMDIYVTAITLAGGKIPDDRPIDGYDISPVLFAAGPSPRHTVYYYRGTKLYALRHKQYKAHFITQSAYGKDKPVVHPIPELYNLVEDPSERFDLAAKKPEIVAVMRKLYDEHVLKMVPGENQFEKVGGH